MAFALGPMRPDGRHERIFVRRRSRRILLIGIAALAMLGSSGAFLAFYRSMTRPTAPADVPLLRADTTPMQHRPENPGGVEVPGQGTMVLDGGQGEPKVEQLLPPPETPLPRPTPSADSAADSSQPSAAPAAPPASALVTPAVPPPAALPPVVAATPEPPRAAPPAPAPRVAMATPAPPRPAPHAPAAASKPPAASVATGKAYRLQVGAVRSAEAAKQEWERLRRANAQVLGGLTFSTQRVDLGARGIFYRIEAGPIADAAKAERDCSALKQRGVGCILVKP
jgi:cell division septation protein DedD